MEPYRIVYGVLLAVLLVMYLARQKSLARQVVVSGVAFGLITVLNVVFAVMHLGDTPLMSVVIIVEFSLLVITGFASRALDSVWTAPEPAKVHHN